MPGVWETDRAAGVLVDCWPGSGDLLSGLLGALGA